MKQLKQQVLYFQTLKDIAVQALYADTTTSGDEYIQADTEDSLLDSDSADPELGRADYWECVKCKNKQNNPLYRYCERCYQVGVSFIFLYISNLKPHRDWFLKK